MQSRMWKLVSVMMVALVPFSLLATEPGALATPSGSVTLNGNALSRESAVFPGDRIGTTDGAVALTLAGSSVQVGPKSSVVFSSNQLTVASGGIKVETTKGMSGQIRNLNLQPAGNAKSVYTVAERNGKILIAALQGSLSINDGHQLMTLAADHAVAIPVQDSTQDQNQKNCKKGDKKCATGAAGAGSAGAAGGAAAAGASVSTAAAVGIAAAASAVSAGVSYGVARATQQTSSSHP
jgi:hypothetical protein